MVTQKFKMYQSNKKIVFFSYFIHSYPSIKQAYCFLWGGQLPQQNTTPLGEVCKVSQPPHFQQLVEKGFSVKKGPVSRPESG